jgi:hypothetical protein
MRKTQMYRERGNIMQKKTAKTSIAIIVLVAIFALGFLTVKYGNGLAFPLPKVVVAKM